MIKLDISTLIFYYTLLSAIIILIVWIASGYRRRKGFSARDADYTWKCAVCSNVYVASIYEDISKCPLCGSYNKREAKGVVR